MVACWLRTYQPPGSLRLTVESVARPYAAFAQLCLGNCELEAIRIVDIFGGRQTRQTAEVIAQWRKRKKPESRPEPSMRFPQKERLALTHHKVVAPSKFDMMTFNCINISSSSNNNNNNRNVGIPVGFRFHPTDEELVGCYLLDKVSRPPPDPRDDLRIIRELDLYRHEPWDLSEVCKIPGDHSANQNNWYFFSHKDKKYPTGNRANRATKAGFWKATGRDKCIQTRGAVGMRKTLVFYRGRAPHGQKTDWIMHEFRLDAPGDALTSIHNRHSAADHEDAGAWVVCRVFRKTKNLKSKGGDSNNSNNNDTPTTSVEEDHQMALLPEITDSTEKFSSDEGEHVDYPPVDMLHYNHCKQELLSLTDYSHHELAPGALMLPNGITSSSDSMFRQQRSSYVEYNTFGQQQQQQQQQQQDSTFEHQPHLLIPSTSSAAEYFSALENNPYQALLGEQHLPQLTRYNGRGSSTTPSCSSAILEGLEDFRFGCNTSLPLSMDQTLTDVVSRPLQQQLLLPQELEATVPFATPWNQRDLCHASEVNNTTFLEHQH